jgi:hypothetical protein
MRACPQCQRTYPDDTDFCPRDATPLSPVAAVSDRRPAIGDRRSIVGATLVVAPGRPQRAAPTEERTGDPRPAG